MSNLPHPTKLPSVIGDNTRTKKNHSKRRPDILNPDDSLLSLPGLLPNERAPCWSVRHHQQPIRWLLWRSEPENSLWDCWVWCPFLPWLQPQCKCFLFSKKNKTKQKKQKKKRDFYVWNLFFPKSFLDPMLTRFVNLDSFWLEAFWTETKGK